MATDTANKSKDATLLREELQSLEEKYKYDSSYQGIKTGEEFIAWCNSHPLERISNPYNLWQLKQYMYVPPEVDKADAKIKEEKKDEKQHSNKSHTSHSQEGADKNKEEESTEEASQKDADQQNQGENVQEATSETIMPKEKSSSEQVIEKTSTTVTDNIQSLEQKKQEDVVIESEDKSQQKQSITTNQIRQLENLIKQREVSIPQPTHGAERIPQPVPRQIQPVSNLINRANNLGNNLLNRGGGKIGSAIGNNAGRLAASLGKQIASKAVLLNPYVLIAIVVVIALLLLVVIIIVILKPGGENGRDLGEPGGGDIASCSFTRSDQTPPAAQFKSNILMGYFQEASRLSGVPTSLLAGFARVESPSLTNYTDETLSSFPCARSSTGALGLMQLQPPPTVDRAARPDAYFGPGIDLGASFLNMRTEQLTKNDFCDLRKNIILASGFIIKKTGSRAGTPTATVWSSSWDNQGTINALAESYYGCELYPSCKNGPYKYGDDLWKSITSCQSSPSNSPGNPLTPPPSNPSTLKTDIQNKFSITMNGFDTQQLQWAWEQLWRLSNTSFITLVKGTVVNSDSSSWQESCRVIHLKPFATEELFKVIFTHELGHIVRWCSPNSQSRIGSLSDIITKESYVTYYSGHANTCTGSDNFNEDYAEMIAYYLNPSASSQTAACGGNGLGPNPYLNNNHPLHYNTARDILGNL